MWVTIAVVLVIAFSAIDGDDLGRSITQALFGATGGTLGTLAVLAVTKRRADRKQT